MRLQGVERKSSRSVNNLSTAMNGNASHEGSCNEEHRVAGLVRTKSHDSVFSLEDIAPQTSNACDWPSWCARGTAPPLDSRAAKHKLAVRPRRHHIASHSRNLSQGDESDDSLLITALDTRGRRRSATIALPMSTPLTTDCDDDVNPLQASTAIAGTDKIPILPRTTNTTCVSGPPQGSGVAGPPQGSGVAGPPQGSGVAGPPQGSGVAGPPQGSGVASMPTGAPGVSKISATMSPFESNISHSDLEPSKEVESKANTTTEKQTVLSMNHKTSPVRRYVTQKGTNSFLVERNNASKDNNTKKIVNNKLEAIENDKISTRTMRNEVGSTREVTRCRVRDIDASIPSTNVTMKATKDTRSSTTISSGNPRDTIANKNHQMPTDWRTKAGRSGLAKSQSIESFEQSCLVMKSSNVNTDPEGTQLPRLRKSATVAVRFSVAPAWQRLRQLGELTGQNPDSLKWQSIRYIPREDGSQWKRSDVVDSAGKFKGSNAIPIEKDENQIKQRNSRTISSNGRESNNAMPLEGDLQQRKKNESHLLIHTERPSACANKCTFLRKDNYVLNRGEKNEASTERRIKSIKSGESERNKTTSLNRVCSERVVGCSIRDIQEMDIGERPKTQQGNGGNGGNTPFGVNLRRASYSLKFDQEQRAPGRQRHSIASHCTEQSLFKDGQSLETMISQSQQTKEMQLMKRRSVHFADMEVASSKPNMGFSHQLKMDAPRRSTSVPQSQLVCSLKSLPSVENDVGSSPNLNRTQTTSNFLNRVNMASKFDNCTASQPSGLANQKPKPNSTARANRVELQLKATNKSCNANEMAAMEEKLSQREMSPGQPFGSQQSVIYELDWQKRHYGLRPKIQEQGPEVSGTTQKQLLMVARNRRNWEELVQEKKNETVSPGFGNLIGRPGVVGVSDPKEPDWKILARQRGRGPSSNEVNEKKSALIPNHLSINPPWQSEAQRKARAWMHKRGPST
uniref:uncharacterized protein n=1 Tax=Myxine glutinosa TaxID=7769 RepID=UPI00358E495B